MERKYDYLWLMLSLLLLWLKKLRRNVFSSIIQMLFQRRKNGFQPNIEENYNLISIVWTYFKFNFKIIQLMGYGIFSIMFRCVEISMEMLFLWTETKLAHKKNMCSLRLEALNCLLYFFLNLFLSFSVNSTQMTKPKCWQLKAGKIFS